MIKALSTSLTKTEVYHPYFRVPYKSLPQDNVQSYNHDGRTPIHLATQTANSVNHQKRYKLLSDTHGLTLITGYVLSFLCVANVIGCFVACAVN